VSADRTRRSLLVLIACGTLVATAAADGPRLPSEVARDLSGLDGTRVTVVGTLGRVRTHISKRGERSYSFPVSDERAAVAVLASTRPACDAGARVIAHGIVDARSRRVDAATVQCP